MKILQKLLLVTLITTALIILILEFSPINTPADSELTTVGYKYTVGEYNGRVAVFIYGEKTPKTILDCRIAGLPKSDAENLRKGIHVNDDEELQYLIEAFD